MSKQMALAPNGPQPQSCNEWMDENTILRIVRDDNT